MHDTVNNDLKFNLFCLEEQKNMNKFIRQFNKLTKFIRF